MGMATDIPRPGRRGDLPPSVWWAGT